MRGRDRGHARAFVWPGPVRAAGAFHLADYGRDSGAPIQGQQHGELPLEYTYHPFKADLRALLPVLYGDGRQLWSVAGGMGISLSHRRV